MNENIEIWITNISKKVERIHDLGLKLYPNQSINLLAIKKPKYTLEQIEDSYYKGSLKEKKQSIIISFQSLNVKYHNSTLQASNKILPRGLPSVIQIDEQHFEELEESQFISPNFKDLLNSDN